MGQGQAGTGRGSELLVTYYDKNSKRDNFADEVKNHSKAASVIRKMFKIKKLFTSWRNARPIQKGEEPICPLQIQGLVYIIKPENIILKEFRDVYLLHHLHHHYLFINFGV